MPSGYGDGFGVAVAVSDDGLKYATSAPFRDHSGGVDTDVGGVWIYHWDFGTNDWELAQTLSNTGSSLSSIEGDENNAYMGQHTGLAFSGDGDSIAMGLTGGGGFTKGKVWVFKWHSTNTQYELRGTQEALFGSNNGDKRGESVALNYNGDWLAVGDAWWSSAKGRLVIFEFVGSDWSESGYLGVSSCS
jgi:hypothetical protein